MLFILCNSCMGNDRKIENIRTFAKLYGYVRWFYPGDEAASNDWNRFAIYGIQRVENARNQKELKQILLEIFKPVAPALIIEEASYTGDFNIKNITPTDTSGYKAINWLHFGVNLGVKSNIYRSYRINRDSTLRNKICFLNILSEISEYQGKEVKMVISLKSSQPASGNVYLLLSTISELALAEYVDNSIENRAIVRPSDQWSDYETIIKVNSNDSYMTYGLALDQSMPLYISDIKLMIKENNIWKSIEISSDCEINRFLYDFKTDSLNQINGKFVYEISRKKFGTNMGEFIRKDIGNDLVCIMPLALYANRESTFPMSDELLNSQLKEKLLQISDTSLYTKNINVRLANIVIAWNVFQHFYPYFDVVDVDWDKELSQTLSDAYDVKAESDYFKDLCRMVAKLQDGHGLVINDNIKQWGPPFTVGLIENKVVIKASNSKFFQKGDIIETIDGKSSMEELMEQERYISGSPQLKRYRALNMFGSGFSQSEAVVTVNRDNIKIDIKTKRDSRYNPFFNMIGIKNQHSIDYGNGIYYANSSWETDFNEELSKLIDAKGVIVSSFYDVSKLIPHIILEPVWTPSWNVPIAGYPDRENISFDKNQSIMKPEKPHIYAKFVFIEEPFNVSSSETDCGIINHYKLGKLIGDTTAGTNGDVNFIPLMGGYSIMWTGMKVLKHDGSQHHLIGYRPDFPVSRTIKGIKEGKDEYLEKAIEVLKAGTVNQ